MFDKILSWNVRGSYDARKREVTRGCLNRWKPSIISLQESKLSEVNKKIIRSIWSFKDTGWCSLPAKGAAGGIIIMWKKDKILCHSVMLGDVSLSCLFSNLSNGDNWHFSGVYCRGNSSERNLLNAELEKIKFSLICNGIFGGDFNIILRKSERSGNHTPDAEIENFLSIINNLDLIDLPLAGGKWTKSNLRDQSSFSRIDKFLFSADLLSSVPKRIQKLMPRPISDHFPIMLFSDGINGDQSLFVP